jgi:WD40 repeat protein
VSAATFAPDGRVLTGSWDRTARLWDAAGEPVGAPLRSAGMVVGVSFAAGGKEILTTWLGQNGFHRWEAPGDRSAAPPLRVPGRATHVEFRPDGKVLFVRGVRLEKGWDVHRWDMAEAAPDVLQHDWQDGARLLAMNHSGAGCRTLQTGPTTATLRSWVAWDGPVTVRELSQPRVSEAAFSPDGRWLLTAGDDHRIRIWDATSGEPRGEPWPEPGEVSVLAFLDGGKQALVGTRRGTLRRFDLATGKELAPLARDTGVWWRDEHFSPEHGRVVAPERGSARVWDTITDTPVGPSFELPIAALQWVLSPGGKLAAAVGIDQGVRVWDAATGKPVGALLPHRATLRALAFSPDAALLATATETGEVHLWDVAAGKPVGRPLRLGTPVWHVAFSPDGTRLAACGEDGSVAVWRVPAPVAGAPELLHVWACVLTGCSADQRGTLFELDAEGFQGFREYLKQAGGPPRQ